MAIQVAPDDCTGCGLCVDVCPAKDKERVKHKAIDMEPKIEHLERERANWDFFLTIPDVDRTQVKADTIKGSQLLAAAVRVLRGLRRLRRNALRQAAHAVLRRPHADRQRHRLLVDLRRQPALHALRGRTTRATGPAWSNSLFEDCAEFGLGFRLAIDQQIAVLPHAAWRRLGGQLGDELVAALLDNQQETDEEIARQRARVAELNRRLADDRQRRTPRAWLASADYLIRKSVWSFGGDGWAYDIGFGGLDHVFASGRDVNILVLDTEVYSNTGGQASKSTPRGAVAKFAAGGKPGRKKDLGMIAMAYGNVFVGQISMGANPAPRPADHPRRRELPRHFAVDRLQPLHRLGHRHDRRHGACRRRRWPAATGRCIISIRATRRIRSSWTRKKPAGDFKEFAMKEARFAMLARSKPEASARLLGIGPAGHQRPLALLRAVGRRGARWPERRRATATTSRKLQRR